MVKTNIQTFTGEVEILSNLHVGPSGSSYLTANGAASNVLDITGNVGATFFVGDGGFLSNIATTLSDIVNQGNVSANVLQFNSTSDYAGVGLVTSSNVGIQNTAPSHTLSIGDKIRVDDNTVETSGQSVIQVDGRILATRFQGDGGLLSNIATTFESIVNQGNVASNVVKFSSDSAYAGAGVITDSNVGIQNTAPTHNLSVGSNLHVNDTGSNVLTVHGNVMASNLNLGIFSITPAYGLNDVCNTSNGTSNVVQFQNATTSLVATSNITVGGNVTAQQLISTSNTEVGDRLKFSGSNVFVDTLRVADVAANIVTYDRTTGELLDSSGTFMNKFAVVSEQPPSDLFANATTVANHGGYTLTTSNLATNSNTFNAFDGTANAWVSGGLAGGYIGGSNVFLETNLTQLSNLHPTQFGDWLAIEFPYKTTLRHMKLTPLTTAQFPASANIYATNNDLTWTEINYWSGRNPVTASNVQTIVVNSTEQFKKYALVATKAAGDSSNVALRDWQLFTESFSIDGGKVAMAQQAATGGETVMDQHGPHSRGAAKLKKYPEIAFDASKLDGNDSTNTYVQAGYTVSSSRQETSSGAANFRPYTAFDGLDKLAAKNEFWLTGNFYTGTGTTGTNGDADQNATLFNSRRGEWIQLETPNKIKVNKFIIKSRTYDSISPRDHPKSGYLYASNNGTDWQEIKSFTNLVYVGVSPATSGSVNESHGTVSVDVNSTDYYRYFRLQVTQRVANTFWSGSADTAITFLSLGELEYYGYEEDPPLGDTSVDTTFTSIMNTPQTTGAQVYVDGSLGETFTNRVVGPTVSNTHTTYVSTEKYWELSGNVESNVTLEANTFLSGDAPHSLSMWFNSSNLVSNASNSCIFSLGTEERLDHVSAAFSNTYQTVQKITASDGATNEYFGAGHGEKNIAMTGDGSVVVSGAKYDNGNIGAVYVFVKDANGHWNEVQKLTASDATADDLFGAGVDISSDGNYIAIGARLAHSTDGNNVSNVGKIYIFKRTTGTNSWSEQQILSSPNEGEDDHFGRRVSISSDGTYVVTACQNEDHVSTDNRGAAYVFKRTDTTWATAAYRLVASDAADSDFFGSVADISDDGNFIAVGVMHHDGAGTDDDGAVYMFARTGDNTWTQQQKINNPDVSGVDNYFGGENQAVSISSDGTYLIVGAYGRASQNGAVFFFKRTGTSTSDWAWGQIGGTYTEPGGATGNLFGRAVRMSPDGLTALVHSRNDEGGTDVGAVFVYKRSGSTWTYKHKIQHKDQTADDFFGSALDISTDGSYFVAGMYEDDDLGSKAGAAYIYTRDTTHHLTTDLKLQSNTWHNLTYAYQGEGGSRVTYLDGRKVAEDQVEDTFGDYPPFAMTGYSQGGYVASASSEHNPGAGGRPWEAFNDDPVLTGSDVTGSYWQSIADTYETSGSYNWTGTGVQFTDTNGGQHSGEWIKLEMPHKLRLNYISYLSTYTAYTAKNFVILGSNDDTSWTLLKSVTNGPSTEDVYHDLVINADRSYKYYVVLTSAVHGGGGEVLFSNIKYYGHRENDPVRLPDPTNVLKYPHIAMTGPGQRGYVVSASSFYNSDTEPEHGFDGVLTSGGLGHTWQSGPLGNNTTTGSGRYTAGSTFNTAYLSNTPLYGEGGFQTPELSNTWTGEWLQIQLPHSINTTKYVFGNADGNSDWNDRIPTSGVILGSTSGSTWNLVHQFSSTLKDQSLTISHTGYYKYFRLVGTTVGGSQALMLIPEWELYGTGVDSIPIQIGGGNIDKVANFRVYDKFIGEDQALEIWDAQKDEFGRAKSSMTLQKGRLGIGTTEPEGRLAVLDEPHNLEEFPPRAMTGYETYMEGHGVFCASASSSYGIYNPWEAFDRNTTDTAAQQAVWHTLADFTNATPGIYNAGASLGGYTGAWLKLKLPYSIKPSKVSIYPRTYNGAPPVADYAQNPKDFLILGSKDDNTWDVLSTQVGVIFGATWKDFILSPGNNNYRYFAISCTKIKSGQYFAIADMKYFGTREHGQSVLHDGTLTLTNDLRLRGRIFNSGFGLIIPLDNSKNVRVVQAYTGSDVSFTVPSGVSRIYVKLWGAGGGGGYRNGWTYGSPGGAGGFTHGVIATTPGEILTLIVGQGGIRTGGSIYGGGAYKANTGSYGASGGGRSAIRRGSTELITAGGGGGGGATRSASFGGSGNRGGAGGGLIGQNGASAYDGRTSSAGGGGGQSLGDIIEIGANHVGASYGDAYGSQFQGGASHDFGGGGGGGWYGGGAGQYIESNTMGGGGGGSGYVGGCVFGQTFTGHFSEPANIADVDYVTGIGDSGIGWSGASSAPSATSDINNSNGKNGFMVIYY
jgi:hypothetical protein